MVEMVVVWILLIDSGVGVTVVDNIATVEECIKLKTRVEKAMLSAQTTCIPVKKIK